MPRARPVGDVTQVLGEVEHGSNSVHVDRVGEIQRKAAGTIYNVVERTVERRGILDQHGRLGSGLKRSPGCIGGVYLLKLFLARPEPEGSCKQQGVGCKVQKLFHNDLEFYVELRL